MHSAGPLHIYAQQTSYADALPEYLHEELRLPEYGEVKMQITLRSDGSVVRLVVLHAASAKNRGYLERCLPGLHFPPFYGALVGVKEQTFVLTFCND